MTERSFSFLMFHDIEGIDPAGPTEIYDINIWTSVGVSAGVDPLLAFIAAEDSDEGATATLRREAPVCGGELR